MYVTLQLPLLRVQVVPVKLPVLLLEKVTVPVGVIAPVPEESETVAVQVVVPPVLRLLGLQVTFVVDNLKVEASVKVALLTEWILSPP